MSANVREEIQKTIDDNPVVLFMKGRRRMPQCGFSATLVGILDQLVEEYITVNVLASQEMRQGIKEFSNWPTIPQLYIKGEFVGGCDIVQQMFAQGELQSKLGVEVEKAEAPEITVTESALAELRNALGDDTQSGIRISVDARFRPDMGIDSAGAMDASVDVGGLTFIFDAGSAKRSAGLMIDFLPGADGGFKLDNPNAPAKVKEISPEQLKVRLEAKADFIFIDVRGEEEKKIASIEGARLLDEAFKEELLASDKSAELVFHCHHGGRSKAAAEFFLQQGFKKVYNLTGGIDAWSQQVDDTVPRY